MLDVGGGGLPGFGGEANDRKDGQRQAEGGQCGPQHVADVQEQVVGGDRGRYVGGVRQWRHLVAEVGPGNHRAGGNGWVQAERSGNTHQCHTEGTGGGPAGTDAEADNSADQATGGVEPLRGENLHTVVNHRGYGTRENPAADQRTDCQQDQDSAKDQADAVQHPTFHLVPGKTVFHPHQGGNAGTQQQGDLVGAVRGVCAVEVHRQGE